MPVFQYKCGSCAAIFEYLMSAKFKPALDCVACGSDEVSRVEVTSFYPNKNFCPHDKLLDKELLKTQLGGIMKDTSLKCGGCGTDGSPGKCSSKGGGCGSGGGCGGGCSCSSKKLNLEIYEKKAF